MVPVLTRLEWNGSNWSVPPEKYLREAPFFPLLPMRHSQFQCHRNTSSHIRTQQDRRLGPKCHLSQVQQHRRIRHKGHMHHHRPM
jgi:hypothetical protein